MKTIGARILGSLFPIFFAPHCCFGGYFRQDLQTKGPKRLKSQVKLYVQEMVSNGTEKGRQAVGKVGTNGTRLDTETRFSSIGQLAMVSARKLAILTTLKCMFAVVARQNGFWTKMAARMLDPANIATVSKVRDLLSTVDDHGVVDVFSKYNYRDVLLSIYAFSRLQEIYWSSISPDGSNDESNLVSDDKLVSELAHYSRFAAAAYGWKMNFAFGRGFHVGDKHIILRKTGLAAHDLIAFQRESRAHRPAYFIARDKGRKAIVVCIRGTWSASDVLTDLCCSSDDFEVPASSYFSYWWKTPCKIRVHHGIGVATRMLDDSIRERVQDFMAQSPGYSLIIVGHSMGGSVAALLGALWHSTYPSITVYTFGSACISTQESPITGVPWIFSVISDHDPFRSLSLGHVADISVAISALCEDPHLRRSILMRTSGTPETRDMHWSLKTLSRIRNDMRSEKLFPPGRILQLGSVGRGSSRQYILQEVPAQHFNELRISRKMFDLSKHIPSRYERALTSLLNT